MSARVRITVGIPLVAVATLAILPASGWAQSTVPAQVVTARETLTPVERGDLLMAHQQYAQAIEAYEQTQPTAAVYNKLGLAYHHLMAIGTARREYKKALMIQPDFAAAINNLGATYFAQDDFKRAVKLYRRALKLKPKSARITANLGTAYFACRKYRKGMKAYRRAFQLDPTVFGPDQHPIVAGASNLLDRAKENYAVAVLFAQAGMKDLAIEYLRKALGEGFHDWVQIDEEPAFNSLRKTADYAKLVALEKASK
jgi:tetratricopeptide (TPR) repeat protein